MLERVEFLLEAQLLFANRRGSVRFAQIADLMEETAARLAELDLHRELLLTAHGPAPSLAELCDAVEAPWDQVFRDHQRWFSTAVERTGHLLEQNRMTMGSTLDLINRFANGLTNTPPSEIYNRQGRATREHTGPVLFDGRA